MEDRILLSAAPWTPDLGAIAAGPNACDVEVSLNSDTGTLKIAGSSCDDSVSIESVRMGLDVTANGDTTHFTPLQKGMIDLISFTGSEGDDHFENSSGKDTWAFGGDGDDTIQTSWGDDLIHSGEGDDVISSGAGSDIVTGAEGADTINSGSGNDFVYGHDGDDSIEAGNGDDNIQGGDGDDSIKAGSGDDSVDGGAGNDTLYGQSGDDQIEGEDGNDKLYGNSGEDVLYGDDGNDYLSGSDGEDKLYGGDGADTVYGSDGNDELSGGSGQDRLYGGDNDDVIEGGSGSDRIYGQSGADDLEGNSGNDTIYGSSGNDTIHTGSGTDFAYGGSGEDRMFADSGKDNLQGGNDKDTLISLDNASGDTMTGGGGNDVFWGDSGDSVTDANSHENSYAKHLIGSFDNGADRTLDGDTVNPGGALFAKDDVFSDFGSLPLFSEDGPQRTDIDQGAVGNCWLMAGIGTIADENPERIRDSIVDFGDGTYGVNLGNEYFRVDGQLAVDEDGNPKYAGLGDNNSLWSAVVEKAWSEYRHDWSWGLDAGWTTSVWEAFDGTDTDKESFGWFSDGDDVLSHIDDALDDGKVATILTDWYGSLESDQLVNCHYYMVDSVNMSDRTVNLVNPHGSGSDNYEITISADDLYSDISRAIGFGGVQTAMI